METKKEIMKKIRMESRKSHNLSEISKNKNLSFEKGKELQKKQDEAFKKFEFFKKLSNAMNEVEK